MNCNRLPLNVVDNTNSFYHLNLMNLLQFYDKVINFSYIRMALLYSFLYEGRLL